jgi:hypothetical protein
MTGNQGHSFLAASGLVMRSSSGRCRRCGHLSGCRCGVARLMVSLPVIERRLASDVTSGRRDDVRAAATSTAAVEGTGVENGVISNDRAIAAVGRDAMTYLGWR